MSKKSKAAKLAAYNERKALHIARETAIKNALSYGNNDAWNDVLDLTGPKVRVRCSSDERIDNAIRVEFSTHNSRHQSKFGLSGRTKQYSKERITKINGAPVK